MSKSVAVQSVLFANEEHDIERAAEAAINALRRAVNAERIDTWEYNLGDCAPRRTLSDESWSRIDAAARGAGGRANYEYFDANLGSAAGHNRLAAASQTDLIIIMNPDARMDPDAVESMVRALRPGVGEVEARQVPLDHPKAYEQFTGDTSWASTACALTSRAVFEAVHGFDAESFFLYGDDVDFSWRVRLAGYRVVFEPSARVFHDKRLTKEGGWPVGAAERYYSAEASLMIAHKYSNPERVKQLLDIFGSSRTEHLERAARNFRAARDEGRLASPIDPDHSVAQFIGDNYAEHRF